MILLLTALITAQEPRVVTVEVTGTLEKAALAGLQSSMAQAIQRGLLQRYQVVPLKDGVTAPTAVTVRIRGDRAYVRVVTQGVAAPLVRVPDQKSARRPTVNAWMGPLREELVLDVADAVSSVLLHPRRPVAARARGTRVQVSWLDADVHGPDEDILALEIQTALPTVASCLDNLKNVKLARDVELLVAWSSDGRAVGVHLSGFEDEPAVQQCLTLQGGALSVPSSGDGAATGTCRLRVEPAL